jgi:hypothetical protein
MNSRELVETMVARWSAPDARPLFGGELIDEDGCCCAQGDVLRTCGVSEDVLRAMEQSAADREVARLLGISRTHATLLRQVNDSREGCPQDVLARPELIVGDQAPRILAFWRRLDRMPRAEWAAAGAVAWGAAVLTLRCDLKSMRVSAAWEAGWKAAWEAAREVAGSVARGAAWEAAGSAARAAAWATTEVQGAPHLSSFFFLPMFGIADPGALDETLLP